METSESLRIVELKAENVKRLQAVEIKPSGRPLVCIGGRNGQGKSSVLDSLAYALGGKSVQCEQPVRQGTEQASVTVTLSNGLVVKRTIKPDGKGQVVVSKDDGARFPSPQAVLDGLYGQLTLDPLAFLRATPKQQAETLRALVGLDLSALDGQYADAYEQRTEINREVKRLEGQLAGMSVHADVPEAPVSIDAVVEELRAAERTNAENAKTRAIPDNIREEIRVIGRAKASLQKQIKDLEAKLEEMKAEVDKSDDAIIDRNCRLRDAIDVSERTVDIDTEAIKSKVFAAHKINEKIKDNQARQAVAAELREQRAISEALTGSLAEIEGQKEEMLAAAEFPVDGLAFSADGVTFRGIPLAQCSSAEQLRISVAMAFAMQPKLRVALIRDGSLLDAESLELVAQIAAEHGGEVWVERVGTGAECQVIIEDGEVAEDRNQQEDPGLENDYAAECAAQIRHEHGETL